MTATAHIFEGTRENFRELVVENSARGPVLVHFWADWAGPCHRLFPVLADLAREYGGRFLLVNLNTDAQPAVAREYGVNSVPTVKLFRGGQVVDTVHGYRPEGDWREILDRHTGRGTDPRLVEALRLYKAGQVDEGLAVLARAALDSPDDSWLPATLGRLLMAQGRRGEAQRVLTGLPEAVRGQPDIAHLLTHLELLQAAESAPAREELAAHVAAEPGDCEARFNLAVLSLVADDYEGALTQLLEVVQRDRSLRNDVGRRGMLAVFALLGNEAELVGRYRPLLFRALH